MREVPIGPGFERWQAAARELLRAGVVGIPGFWQSLDGMVHVSEIGHERLGHPRERLAETLRAREIQ